LRILSLLSETVYLGFVTILNPDLRILGFLLETVYLGFKTVLNPDLRIMGFLFETVYLGFVTILDPDLLVQQLFRFAEPTIAFALQFIVQVRNIVFCVLEPDMRHLRLLGDRLDYVVFTRRNLRLAI
jgi:hypothetical protein